MRKLLVLVLCLSLYGCGITLWQREKHSYTVAVISNPKWQPGTSVLEKAIGLSGKDVVSMPGSVIAGSVASDAVKGLSGSELIIHKHVFPADRNYKFSVTISKDQYKLDAEPVPGIDK